MEQYYQDVLDSKMQELAKIEETRERLIKSISVIAHDLKSPLAAIQSYFSMILGGYAGEVNDTIRQMIERSSIRINGLLDLIGDLLDISRIEMGQMADEMETISLAEVLDVCLQDIHRLAEEKHLELIKDISTDLPPIHGAFNRLQQVFSNLMSNAVKFTPEGGVINLKLCEKDGKILGTVRDAGIGIPDEDIAYVFKDFYRGSNVEKGTGTGLGLSIVRMIVEAHGGEVWVESPCVESGTGSEFFVSLPIVPSVPEETKKVTAGRKVSS
jgi:signal transduction histidine kinase